MSTEKRQVRPWAKAVVVSGVCAAVFSIAWMLESKKKATENSHLTALVQPAHAINGNGQESAKKKNNPDAASASEFSEVTVGKPLPVDMAAQILSPIKQVRPDLPIADIRFSHIKGVYKATLQDKPMFFSANGRFFIVGEMYEITNHQLVNLQEEEQRELEAAFAPQRAKMLENVAKKDMVIFPAEGNNTKTHVYVFTDIDCGFCRKLHRQMPEMQARGIEVRYLAFPRAGVNSTSAQKLATTWCADNPRETMTQFKEGKDLTLSPCAPNPIADHYALGQKIGVRGTPAIVLASGQMVPGAVETQQLIDILKEANLYY